MLAEIAADAVRDRILVLRTLPQFATLDESDLGLLAENAHLSVAPNGKVLFRENEELDRVYLVASGRVQVRDGETTYIVEAPNEVGLLSLFAGRDRAKETIAVGDATVLELPAGVILSSYYESVSIARNTIRMAAKTLLTRRGNLPFRPEEARDVSTGPFLERTPTLVERMIVMRRWPLWSEANLDALTEMCRHVQEFRAPAGTTLWEVGDAGTYSYRLEYGIVVCTNADGESVRVGGGQILGGLDALAGVQRSYRVVTETDCIFFRIRASTQLGILEVHPQLAARLRMHLSRAILDERAGRGAVPSDG